MPHCTTCSNSTTCTACESGYSDFEGGTNVITSKRCALLCVSPYNTSSNVGCSSYQSLTYYNNLSDCQNDTNSASFYLCSSCNSGYEQCGYTAVSVSTYYFRLHPANSGSCQSTSALRGFRCKPE